MTTARIITFASGQATAPLPDSFSVTSDSAGLVALFGSNLDHKLELTLLERFPSSNGATDVGANFVRNQAHIKHAKVSGTADRAVFTEPGGEFQTADKAFRVVHWQIGVGNCVFTMTVTAPIPMSNDLQTFLGEPLNALVRDLNCNAL